MAISKNTSRERKVLKLFIQLLFSGKKFHLDDLARQYSCSIEEIRGMVKTIRLSGIKALDVIEGGEDDWVQLFHQHSAERLMLPAEDLARLVLCIDMIKRLLPDGLGYYIFKLSD